MLFYISLCQLFAPHVCSLYFLCMSVSAYQKRLHWIALRSVLPNELMDVLLLTSVVLALNEKAFPCLETFAGLHYHSVQLSSGICRSL